MHTTACRPARSAATAVSGRGPHPHYGAGQEQPPLPAVPALTARSRVMPRPDGMQGLLSGGRSSEPGDHICPGLTRSPPGPDGTWPPRPVNSAETRARSIRPGVSGRSCARGPLYHDRSPPGSGALACGQDWRAWRAAAPSDVIRSARASRSRRSWSVMAILP